MSQLEEFAKAYLWNDNLVDNFGVMAKDGQPVDADADEFNRRAERLQKALLALPDDLFDEIGNEDQIVYKDMIEWEKRRANSGLPDEDSGNTSIE